MGLLGNFPNMEEFNRLIEMFRGIGTYNVADESAYVTPHGYLVANNSKPIFGVEASSGIVSEAVLYWGMR